MSDFIAESRSLVLVALGAIVFFCLAYPVHIVNKTLESHQQTLMQLKLIASKQEEKPASNDMQQTLSVLMMLQMTKTLGGS